MAFYKRSRSSVVIKKAEMQKLKEMSKEENRLDMIDRLRRMNSYKDKFSKMKDFKGDHKAAMKKLRAMNLPRKKSLLGNT